ncbi:protein kinase domain-containing protein [Sorangium sp. So ce385]|uniref:serine/threonine-protein kinase n=1 Tax=Sorangium sp. So ce385 TaxID=3133308 RepID=UPI003F5C5D70
MNPPVVQGEVIAGKYRVDRVLGRGGMGIVVAASHLLLPQRVAIKLLLSDEGESPSLSQRFLREARAVVRLKGEHVVRVLDVGELDSGVPYIVMEYLEGEDLSEVLRARGPLGVLDAVDYVLQACVAMAEAHAAGIVHRDLKPANLFLATTPGGAKLIKVLDFGISKELPSGAEGGGASLTQTREMLGSPIYMSPEQMRSSRSVDARADIWALGAILYRLLVGRPPFEAMALTELVLQVASAEPARPSELRSDIPAGLERVILHCLQKDPAHRPQTVAELALALAPFAPAGGQERAERAARILSAPPEAPRPAAPAPAVKLELDTTAAACPDALESILPTTRTVARPARRKTLSVVLGAVAAAALALVVSGAVALRRGSPEREEAPQPIAAVAQDADGSERAQHGAADGPAGPPIPPEPPSAADEPAGAAPPQPSVSPVSPAEAVRRTALPQKRRREPAVAPAPTAQPTPVQPTNPFAPPLK